jgi:hypothetical membrane protein
METIIVGFVALIAAVVLIRVIALASKIVIVVGVAAVLIGVWMYPAETYAMVGMIEREALKLIRMVG